MLIIQSKIVEFNLKWSNITTSTEMLNLVAVRSLAM